MLWRFDNRRCFDVEWELPQGHSHQKLEYEMHLVCSLTSQAPPISALAPPINGNAPDKCLLSSSQCGMFTYGEGGCGLLFCLLPKLTGKVAC